jgi:hypothetical protein
METDITQKSLDASKDTSTYQVRELSEEMVKRHNEAVVRAAQTGSKILKGDFWIEIQHFRDNHVQSGIRNKPVVCAVCPVPTINHSVYRYNHLLDSVVHLWTVPGLDSIDFIKSQTDIPPEYRALAQQVHAYLNKSLDRICMEQNKDVRKDNVEYILKNRGMKIDGRRDTARGSC